MTTDPTTSPPATAVPAAGVPATSGSLAAVPRLLRSDPVLAALIGAADATVAVPEAAQSVVAAALAAFTERTPLLVITATGLDAERLGDDLSCLIASEDDQAEDLAIGWGRGCAVGSGHRAAGLGDAPVRAGEPRDRDDGSPPGGAPRADRVAGPPPPGAAAGDRRPGPGHPAAAGPAEWDGTDRHPPGAAGRRGRAADPARRHGLPARAPGGASRRIRGARRHRRRLPLHGGRAGAHRSVGRRGRPPDRVLGERPAVVAGPARRGSLRLP